MKTKWHFTQTEWKNGTLRLLSEEPLAVKELLPARQVITDSDDYAFVYLADAGEKYGYFYFYLPESIWTDLKKALAENSPVEAVGTDGVLPLDAFGEEMEDLLANIEGNSNYGEEMVGKVERVFFAGQP